MKKNTEVRRVRRNKMALATRLQKPVEENHVGDITENLVTLQFENALTDEEKELLYLRKRAHALTVNSCAQAAFLVSILNEARCVQPATVQDFFLSLYHYP